MFPTYDNKVNSSQRLDGVNEADEMNLYAPQPLLDSPYGPSDLEWLYRQQDVDGATMTSRLSQLAPVSFTNTIDGQRRRRLFALDTWETNNFVWTNDNPGGEFANNASVQRHRRPDASPAHDQCANTLTSLDRLRPDTPSAGPSREEDQPQLPPAGLQRPQRADPAEMDQRHLSDAQGDPAAHVGRLARGAGAAQPVRDQHHRLPRPGLHDDPLGQPGRDDPPDGAEPPATAGTPTVTLIFVGSTVSRRAQLDQYGMEYNPVAINEVLAYSFQSRSNTTAGSAVYSNRVFVELVNTLTAAYNPSFDYGAATSPENYYGYGATNQGGNNYNNTSFPYQNESAPPPMQASTLDLGGFTYVKNDPYRAAAGTWSSLRQPAEPARPLPGRPGLQSLLGPPVSA